jgi:hypothetical protein
MRADVLSLFRAKQGAKRMGDAEPRPIAGIVLGLTGLAQIVLLTLHPAPDAHGFAGMLRSEAAARAINAVVHGGFIVVLAIQLVCYALLSARLGKSRAATLAGLVFFVMGSAFLVASLAIDGLIFPALAQRFVPKSIDEQNTLRGVFAFTAATIGILLPMGLSFQGAGLLAWSVRLFAGSRLAGSAAIIAAAAVIAAGILALSNPFFVFAGIVVAALWATLAATFLFRRH